MFHTPHPGQNVMTLDANSTSIAILDTRQSEIENIHAQIRVSSRQLYPSDVLKVHFVVIITTCLIGA